MELKRMEGTAADGTAVFGSLWPRGGVQRDQNFVLKASDGRFVPVQSRVTAVWPDGSVKWAAHTAAVTDETAQETLQLTPSDGEKPEGEPIQIGEDAAHLYIQAGRTSLTVCRKGRVLFTDLTWDGQLLVRQAFMQTILEQRSPECGTEQHGNDVMRSLRLSDTISEIPYTGEIEEVQVCENGPVRSILRVHGTHRPACTNGLPETAPESFLPFILYMEITKDSPELRCTYTFFYDGEEKRDFLKGCGISFTRPMQGPAYNRHVRFLTDHGTFHEAGAMLLSWHPRVAPELYHAQITGEMLHLEQETEAGRNALQAAQEMPVWSEYYCQQDSDAHFSIRKRTAKQDVCRIEGLHGYRAPGAAACADEQTSLYLAVKDFWQKYPTAIRFRDLETEEAAAEVWFWPPWTEAMDFRHYEDTGYSQTYYEGFDVFGASAYGIANTSEFIVGGVVDDRQCMTEEQLRAALQRAQNRALYTAAPEYYHALHAFGRWSLPGRETEAEQFLEDQLDAAVDFYLKEVETRRWYGMFDYGDFMHTYDRERHSWRYDMGGYAWQNTELVPTYWLWFQYLRTGRADIFRLAEAMTRHCSEVDIYHFGKYQGLGSRHNVRHWGCPCKEPRIAMAGHNRMYYYLTGDYRLEDVFADTLDADYATIETDPLRFFFDKKDMVFPTHARTGPDWSSYCSNWMTEWERHGDAQYLERIRIGIADLKETPLKLMSGTDFEYDPKSAHLRYIGDRATGGSHLSICQGSEQTWIELTELLEDPEWTQMVADYGVFYPKSNEEQNRLTDGRIGQRQFSYPFMAAGIIAFGAQYYKDEELGRKVWQILRDAIRTETGEDAFAAHPVENAGNQEVLSEIPGVSTNVFAQWCLNTIVALEFAREWLD
ncbi:MAG: hypothetical protein IJT34_08870 [Butyrivibrio sp.]|nr:hypothetical protein [Butyrivibrio sp.]